MSRAVLGTAITLFVVGAATFLYKHWVLEMPTQPDRDARVWRVELAISAYGDDRPGRIELQLPSSDGRQVILDSQSTDDGLTFSMMKRADADAAAWHGVVGIHRRLAYTFRVHLPKARSGDALGGGAAETTRGRRDESADAGSVAEAKPATAPRRRAAPAFVEVLEQLGIEAGDDPEAIIASLFGFVAHEIESAPGGSDDPHFVLRDREGSEVGKSRLLVDLLRAAGVEADFATGIELRSAGTVEPTPFVEAHARDERMALFTSEDAPGSLPPRFVVLTRSDRPLLTTSGISAATLDIQVLRESLPPSEIASFVSPRSPFWRAVSLYRVPIETQTTLQVLLVLPVAVLIAAIFRNLVGLRTFGTFMPILIALSLRRTDLATGLVLVSSVLLAGVFGRLLLDRLRLLFVPRICLLLCLVILFVTVLAQVGYQFEGTGLMTGLLFPIVILAMLIERISVTTLEEGYESTAILLAGSLLLAALTYPVFQSDWLAHLFFGFPELVLCVMACLVLIGGYTGYRVAELWRFREFAPVDVPIRQAEESPARLATSPPVREEERS